MFMKSACALAAMVAGTASYAATTTYDFTGNYAGTYYNTFYGVDGVSVTSGADYYNQTWVGQWTYGGLGVVTNYDNFHGIDGWGDEYLTFNLESGVHASVTEIVFADYGYNDYFNIVSANGTEYNQNFYNSNTWTGDVAIGDWFSVKITENLAKAKIKSITIDYNVSEVPLPAAGFLLLGGLGGLVALKRRKKA